jgi:SAM-dependent methyltransferase
MKGLLPDVRKILALPFVYNLFKRMIGTAEARSFFVRTYVRPKKGDKILDIGCGTADILDLLSDIEYTGFDMSQEYINSAKKKYGERGMFICKRVSADMASGLGTYDIILAKGILHHLNDDEAVELFKLSRIILKPKGRLITFDGCYVEGQSPIARYLLSRDRGRYVRTKDAYLDMANRVFFRVKVTVHHDLLHIPYTHIIGEYSL